MATYDDVNLIIKLYELRREPKLREARDWFGKSFNARTPEELEALCPRGSEPNAYLRMVVGYWEMVASFITCGVLNQELFFQYGQEMLFVWEKVRDLAPPLRDTAKNPLLLKNMETVAKAYIQWWNKQAPGAYEIWSAQVRGVKGG